MNPPIPDELTAGLPRRRLHPLTPLLRGLRLAAIAVVFVSWQGYQELGIRNWAIAVVAIGAVLLLASVVSWRVTGYEVVGRELRVHEGLLWRRTRAIPLERLQAVELVQPLRARLFGLAELRLEVVGGSRTEAPLAYLSLGAALQLRERLLAMSRVAAAPTPAAPAAPAVIDLAAPAAPAAPVVTALPTVGERRLHVIPNRDLLVSQLLRPQWWVLPIAVAAPVFYFVIDNNLSFVAIASTITAVIGAVQAPVRVLLGDWGFTIASGTDGLRIRRGLLERRSQTVPPGRIQSVGVEWPLLWRGQAWVRARMDVAGVRVSEREQARVGSLLPVADVPTARRVIAEVLPGFDLTTVAVLPVPRRARLLAPLRAGVLGYNLMPTAFVARDGLLTRRLAVVPYPRIQSIRVVQGPLQRLLRLATVHVDTAGQTAGGLAPYRDVREVRALVVELSARARAARLAPRG